ncbi:hypothetical protein MMC07_005959 [Pseudocyphellaria aurata]|nr:hypothetical protein [Pseudocyphellaria aurata]
MPWEDQIRRSQIRHKMGWSLDSVTFECSDMEILAVHQAIADKRTENVNGSWHPLHSILSGWARLCNLLGPATRAFLNALIYLRLILDIGVLLDDFMCHCTLAIRRIPFLAIVGH